MKNLMGYVLVQKTTGGLLTSVKFNSDRDLRADGIVFFASADAAVTYQKLTKTKDDDMSGWIPWRAELKYVVPEGKQPEEDTSEV